jgi:hypothetical protein
LHCHQAAAARLAAAAAKLPPLGGELIKILKNKNLKK